MVKCGRLARATVALQIALLAAPGGVSVPARADEPVLHHVTYIVSAERRVSASIHFRDTDPSGWAEYGHDPYQFSPEVAADIGPGLRWRHDVMLAAPDQWAMVSASGALASATPHLHCELAVDGAVVATGDGPTGALCSLRRW